MADQMECHWAEPKDTLKALQRADERELRWDDCLVAGKEVH